MRLSKSRVFSEWAGSCRMVEQMSVKKFFHSELHSYLRISTRIEFILRKIILRLGSVPPVNNTTGSESRDSS